MYSEVARLLDSVPRRPAARPRAEIIRRLAAFLHKGRHHPPRFNPILVRLALASVAVFLVSTWYFPILRDFGSFRGSRSATTEIYSHDERALTSGNNDWMSEKM